MKYSLATLSALVIAAIASPTPGGGENIIASGYGSGYNAANQLGEGLQIQHVYPADARNMVIVGVQVTPVLVASLLTVNRGIDLSSGYGLTLRNDANQFCQANEQVHGVYGCSQSIQVRKTIIKF